MARFPLNQDPFAPASAKVGAAQLPRTAVSGAFFTVKNYGADPTGVTDSTTAFQNAVNAAITAGGGEVRITTPGTYLLNGPGGTPNQAAGVSWAVGVAGDNVTIRSVPGVTFKTTVNAATFFVAGAGKPAGLASWATQRLQDAAVKLINGPVAAGASSVTTTTHSDAGTFAAGDWVYIRTGETVTGAGPQSNPAEADSEINQVVSANAGTGVVVLRFPLSKPYAQEYFPNGGSLGPTSTSVTAFLAPFGIAKITDRLLQNFSLQGGNFLHTGDGVTGTAPITACLFTAGGIFGLNWQPANGSVIGGHMTQAIEYRYGKFGPYQVHFSSAAPSFAYHSPVNADTACTDVEFTGITASAEKGAVKIELHEGASIVRSRGLLLQNPLGDASIHSTLDIVARAYNHTHDVTIVNGLAGTAIAVDNASPGGGVINATLLGSFPSGGISINSPGWLLPNPRVPDGVTVSYTVTGFVNPQTPLPGALELSAFVDFSSTDVRLGPVPPNSYIVGYRIQTFTPFNAGTTNQISIGTPGNHTLFVAATTVGAPAIVSVTPAFTGWSNVLQDVHAFYTQSGAAATSGRALVTIVFSRSLAQ